MSADSSEDYNKMIEQKIKELYWNIERYRTSVRFLSSIWDFFNNKLKLEIEPKAKIKDEKGKDKKVRPDIVFYEEIESNISDSDNEKKLVPVLVIDYKWSIKRNNKEWIINELNEVYEKYSKICNDVVAMIMEEDVEIIMSISDKINSNLIIWSAKVDYDEEVVVFKDIRGYPKYRKFTKILEENDFTIPLEVINSTCYAFLRHDDPPLPYAAYKIWHAISYIIRSIDRYDVDEYTIKYKDLLKALNFLFPPWFSNIAKIEQIKKRILNKSLKFLGELSFVKRNGQDITVFLSKHNQAKLEYFIKRYVKSKYPKPKYKKRKTEKKGKTEKKEEPKERTKREKQSTLMNFLKKPKETNSKNQIINIRK